MNRAALVLPGDLGPHYSSSWGWKAIRLGRVLVRDAYYCAMAGMSPFVWIFLRFPGRNWKENEFHLGVIIIITSKNQEEYES